MSEDYNTFTIPPLFQIASQQLTSHPLIRKSKAKIMTLSEQESILNINQFK